MRFHSAVCDIGDTLAAGDELVADVRQSITTDIDLLFVFFTASHVPHARRLLRRLREGLSPRCLIGCSAEGVIGAEREVERSAGVAILAAELPHVGVHDFHISSDDWSELLTEEKALNERLVGAEQTRILIGFGDPFTVPLHEFLTGLEVNCPGLPLVGGMASSARRPGQNVLLRNDDVLEQGFVGVALSGPLEVETIVSQGCRPIGQALVITKGHDNIIEHLGGRPATAVLQEVFQSISELDQQLLRNGLFLGRAISEYRDSWSRGDFLVRNVIGIDDKTGGIGVTDYVRVGQTVQFHVRDAQTADEDLTLLLQGQANAVPAAGGLLFSCNGRGTNMFPEPCHDIAAAQSSMPRTPMAGFFAAGELGPIGDRNFIHGHTASFALFRPKRES